VKTIIHEKERWWWLYQPRTNSVLLMALCLSHPIFMILKVWHELVAITWFSHGCSTLFQQRLVIASFTLIMHLKYGMTFRIGFLSTIGHESFNSRNLSYVCHKKTILSAHTLVLWKDYGMSEEITSQFLPAHVELWKLFCLTIIINKFISS